MSSMSAPEKGSAGRSSGCPGRPRSPLTARVCPSSRVRWAQADPRMWAAPRSVSRVPVMISISVSIDTGSKYVSVVSTSLSSYSGWAGRCLDQPRSLACWACSIWRCALSRSTISASRAVYALVRIGPRKPWRTRRGRYPQWSRWAWVTTTAWMSAASQGSGRQLRRLRSARPWKSPQSTRMRAWSLSTRNLLPVTVPTPPRKVRSAGLDRRSRPAAALFAAVSSTGAASSNARNGFHLHTACLPPPGADGSPQGPPPPLLAVGAELRAERHARARPARIQGAARVAAAGADCLVGRASRSP